MNVGSYLEGRHVCSGLCELQRYPQTLEKGLVELDGRVGVDSVAMRHVFPTYTIVKFMCVACDEICHRDGLNERDY